MLQYSLVDFIRRSNSMRHHLFCFNYAIAFWFQLQLMPDMYQNLSEITCLSRKLGHYIAG